MTKNMFDELAPLQSDSLTVWRGWYASDKSF